MATQTPDSGSISTNTLSIALIGPHEQRRRIVASALAGVDVTTVREFTSFPARLSDTSHMLEGNYDVVLIDLDSDQSFALELVENIAANGAVTVMVYSFQSDPNLLMSCMRAGAREFLSQPIAVGALNEALLRAAMRKPTARQTQGNKQGGKVMVFLGGKGGSGVTTVACNYAVSLAQECGQSTVLLDLDLPLGDAALNLGINTQFSTVDALQNYSRLDQNFLSKLLIKHSSGLSVLAAPGSFPR